MNNLYIIGCGGHGRNVADVALSLYPKDNIFFVDEKAKKNEKILGISVLKKLPDNAEKSHVASGKNLNRKKMANLNNTTIISKKAYVSLSAKLGKGCFVNHLAFLGAEVKVGDGCLIGATAVVSHESVIGNYSQICPNATVCGRCVLGENVFVGAGSVIKEGITVCDNVVIGAGAVVINNIKKEGIYVGCPAGLKKKI